MIYLLTANGDNHEEIYARLGIGSEKFYDKNNCQKLPEAIDFSQSALKTLYVGYFYHPEKDTCFSFVGETLQNTIFPHFEVCLKTCQKEYKSSV